jgi:hypothetical protein
VFDVFFRVSEYYETGSRARLNGVGQASRVILTWPPPPTIGGISILKQDLTRLKPGEWLNDSLIEFYLK